ncbi:acetyl-CoA carboxylase biotin carboxylase subunit [Planotetraspora kaengkrachanensis]|uniref:Biotin-dependent 3-methylcrotonyl-coenzyme A carboxylase alpha1 subunit n=2 Tax=Planotetraspora kaengkrachanensis TaxID=575193 RepID=A0A8J3PUZ4_9ACTN|nr:acetyl/propionyl-CoA carboxylase subuit alpha [Planotetraspora kaengkrachanensis]
MMFDSVLIANRGEIAVRIIRTLRAMAVRSVAVYGDADRDAPHVRAADLAVRLPRGYLDAGGIIEAALEAGAQAVHPGYGFLAENADFARRCAEAGLVFVGPPPGAIEAMGDKIRAKATVARAGVPVVPGAAEPGDDLLAWDRFPALIKPSAGGGGKGMLLVRTAAELPDAVESARRTALAAFGDGTLLVERFVETPRHIEIQVMADAHGNAVHLGERECSLQRRHQKIIEEAPSPLLDPETRERMGAAAVEAARSVGYVGAGTVEFIVPGGPGPIEFFFMEMNTRLQVEHPVTEMVTGLDLVELQLRVAAGEPLPFGQDGVRMEGHAVEARVYAEDPSRDFLPTGGRVLALREPEGVRVDSGLAEGVIVGSDYDPMLSKIVAWAPDREGALRRLDRALASTAILGVTTNIAFLRALLTHPEVVAGRLDTGLVERHLADLAGGPVPDEVLAAAALVFHVRAAGDPLGDPWDVADGWRLGERAWTDHRYAKVRGPAGDAEIEVNGRSLGRGRIELEAGEAAVTLAGTTRRYLVAGDRDMVWLGRDGRAWQFPRHEPGDPGDRPGGARTGDGVVRSPMPGTVLVVKAAEGDKVTAGQALLIVEAMKMEHTVTAPHDGVVAELRARAGQTVELDAVLARVTPCE